MNFHMNNKYVRKNEMKALPMAGAGIAATRLPLTLELVPGTWRRSLYLGLCFLCLGTAAAMGSGSGGGGGGGGASVESAPLQQEVGSSAFKVYNQGVDLMRAKKFAAAQIKFEQAIRDNPDFAEAHNNLGFTLRQQGPQNYAKALQHYNKAIQLKPNMAETYEYRGVLLAKMGKKSDAEKDLTALKKLNPKLADELAEFLKTGQEEDEYSPTSPKQKS
jgi:tetratricopeptide (TPR) repeat protein